jgi:Uma2 family endonuclease
MSGSAANALRRHRLTVGDYHRMGDAGIFAPDARVELIAGEIIDMAPIGSRHAGTVSYLVHRLVLAAGLKACVSCQNPIVLDDYSEPQPDLCLLRPRADFYASAHPRPADVLLVVEVAETTLAYDRDIKLPLYARAGIPEVWIIDVAKPILHVHRAPAGDRYAEVTETTAPGIVALAAQPDIGIDLTGIFA